MKIVRWMRAVPALFLLAFTLPVFAQAAAAQPEAILHPADLGKILPDSVFFLGQSATTQARNSGGVRFADGAVMLAALVDNSGYSSGVQQKYQACLLTDTGLDFEGHHLAPGAYGVGIVKTDVSPQFVVMDIGAHDLFQAVAANDAKLHRPTPLQILQASDAGK
ncbi:MAG: hypothetical protein WBP63_08425, partial [Silvibacterium sp.]